VTARTERALRELAASIREEVGSLPDNVLTLGEELKRARSDARMSLQEVADASGFTKSHVWEIEQGRSRNPTVAVIAGLSKGLGVPFLRLAQAAMNSACPAENSGPVGRPIAHTGTARDEHPPPTPEQRGGTEP
jgi:transcriptional regulator with XRE-family HTH domain